MNYEDVEMALEDFITTNIWLIYLLVAWETAWTGIAMWKSARKKHLVWFIVFFLVNLLAIPEILYIFVFSKKGKKSKKEKK